MSGDSLARSIAQTQSYPASPKGDAGYEAYHEAVLSSERGRSFLAEHERRRRQADSEAVLAAVGRIEALLRDGGSRRADRNVESGAQGVVAPVPQADSQRIAQSVAAARAELEAAAGASGDALPAILTAAEQIQEIVWTLRDAGLDARTCDSLDAKAAEIYSACSVANLTGQRVEKAIHLLRDLEARGGTAHADIAAVDDAPPANQSDVSAAPHGDTLEHSSEPHRDAALPSADTDAAQAQTRVAELLRPSLAGVRRRDATIADIARVMGNLIPAASKLSMVGISAAAAEQHSGHSDAQAKVAVGDAAPQEPSSPSPIAVDDFNGFIEAWPQDRSEIDADDPQTEPPSDPMTDPSTSAPAEAGVPARATATEPKPADPSSADPLSSALDSFISRAMGLDKLVKRSVAAAFAQAEAPAVATMPESISRATEPATAPFVSKNEPTQTLREAIAQLAAQRATEAPITPAAQIERSAQPLLLRDERSDAAQDSVPESLLSQMVASDNSSADAPFSFSKAGSGAMKPAPADAAADRPKNTDAAPAPILPTHAPAYASALGSADLDAFLFEESVSTQAPGEESSAPGDGQGLAPAASSAHAKAKSFAQLLDTSIPWAKGPEPRPVPVKVQAPASVKLEIDIAKESAASGATYMPDPLARVRALSIDEKTALFG